MPVFLSPACLWLQEHPVLHRPFLMLHPCQTQAIMQLLTEAAESGAVAAVAAGAGAAVEQDQGSSAAAPGPAAPGPAAPDDIAAPGAAGTAAERTLLYLLAWLSVAGQPLGLGLPTQLWRQAPT